MSNQLLEYIQNEPALQEIYVDYQKTTKNVGEVANTYFYRPLAFPFVKLGQFLHLSPNFFTTLAFLSAVVGAICFSQHWYAWGGFFVLLKQILDCVDGSLARLTKKFSKFGAAFDFIGDVVGMILIMIAIGYSEIQATQDSSIIVLIVISAVTMAVHVLSYNNVRKRYLEQLNPVPTVPAESFLSRLTPYPNLLLLEISEQNSANYSTEDIQALYRHTFQNIPLLWSIVAGAFAVTWVAVAGFIGNFNFLWIILLGVNNILLVGLILLQQWKFRQFPKKLA
ncbi:MAG: CDP-alcohol phosphatidyltransferase family protein [Promethearchaeota archaeon]